MKFKKKDRICKQKSRLSKAITIQTSNFEKQVESLCLNAKQSPKKAKIVFEKIAQLQPTQHK